MAGLSVLGHWTGDSALLASIALPDAFGRSVTQDWTPLMAALEGTGLALCPRPRPGARHRAGGGAQVQGTCGIHAEAYSAAEVLHGPARIVEQGFRSSRSPRAMRAKPASPRSPTAWRGRAQASSPPPSA